MSSILTTDAYWFGIEMMLMLMVLNWRNKYIKRENNSDWVYLLCLTCLFMNKEKKDLILNVCS